MHHFQYCLYLSCFTIKLLYIGCPRLPGAGQPKKIITTFIVKSKLSASPQATDGLFRQKTVQTGKTNKYLRAPPTLIQTSFWRLITLSLWLTMNKKLNQFLRNCSGFTKKVGKPYGEAMITFRVRMDSIGFQFIVGQYICK